MSDKTFFEWFGTENQLIEMLTDDDPIFHFCLGECVLICLIAHVIKKKIDEINNK